MGYCTELAKILDFSPRTCTNRLDIDGNTSIYFGVVVKNGIVNTTKFPSGRRYLEDELETDENFICFKKTTHQNTLPTLQLRDRYNHDLLFKNINNLNFYTFLKQHCKQGY